MTKKNKNSNLTHFHLFVFFGFFLKKKKQIERAARDLADIESGRRRAAGMLDAGEDDASWCVIV